MERMLCLTQEIFFLQQHVIGQIVAVKNLLLVFFASGLQQEEQLVVFGELVKRSQMLTDILRKKTSYYGIFEY